MPSTNNIPTYPNTIPITYEHQIIMLKLVLFHKAWHTRPHAVTDVSRAVYAMYLAIAVLFHVYRSKILIQPI